MQSTRMLKLGWITRISVYMHVCICICIYIKAKRGGRSLRWRRRTFSCLWNEPSSFEGTSIDRALPLKGLITMENATVT